MRSFFFLLLLTTTTWASPCESLLSDAHAAITHDLFNGQIISLQPFSENQNQNTIFMVKVLNRDQLSGRVTVRDAIFKPRNYGDNDGYGRTPMEYVAYFLNRMLGMDYVPPVAYRRSLNLVHMGRRMTEGALIFFSPDFEAMANLPHQALTESYEAILSDHRILNVLLQNEDGHSKNLGLARHWVDGNVRPIFLDFSAGFRVNRPYLSMTKYPAPGNSDPVYRIRRGTFENLKKLQMEHFLPLIQGDLITTEEVQTLLSIRSGIVSFFQNLNDQELQFGHSISKVFIEQ